MKTNDILMLKLFDINPGKEVKYLYIESGQLNLLAHVINGNTRWILDFITTVLRLRILFCVVHSGPSYVTWPEVAWRQV